MEESEFHDVLLDEVCWSFCDKKYTNIEEFYDALQSYQMEITEEWLPEDTTYGLDFREVRIEFDYTEESSSGWKDTRRSIYVKSDNEEFSEVELLYKITAVPLTYHTKSN